eukprot:6835271-Heterocapsa_arctica.AAC.1
MERDREVFGAIAALDGAAWLAGGLEPDARNYCGSGSYGTHRRLHRAGGRTGGDVRPRERRAS